MTKIDRLVEIRRRLDAATSGPWVASGIPYDGIDDPCVIAGDIYICQTVYDMQSGTQEHNIDADTEFIAHAPTDISWLLDKIE